jgi:hypothetical protein
VLRQRGQPTANLPFITADGSQSPKDNNGYPYLMDAGKNDQEFKYPGVPTKFFPGNKKRPPPSNVTTGNGMHHQGFFNRGSVYCFIILWLKITTIWLFDKCLVICVHMVSGWEFYFYACDIYGRFYRDPVAAKIWKMFDFQIVLFCFK